MTPRLAVACLTVVAVACSEAGDVAERAPTFDRQVRAVFAARCDRCHAGDGGARTWRSATYLDAIACTGGSDASVVAPIPNVGVVSSAFLRALDRPDHQGLLSATERAVLERWARAGAPAHLGAMHPTGFVDPRSADFHGRALRAARWRPMLDVSDPRACGRCHAGAPARPPGVVYDVVGATDCRVCHDRPGGALACDTCHGGDGRADPQPSDCLLPERSRAAGAHALHRSPPSGSASVTCDRCHPTRDATLATGEHGDGRVQVTFDRTLAGADARWNATTGTCSVACHDRGGTSPTPAWNDTPRGGCGGCHGTPPARHYAGACTTCHTEVNATGDGLRAATLHLNGRVDVGDGSATCTACHGSAATPWPATGAHTAHRDTVLARGVGCESCHVVPDRVEAAGHLDGVVQVRLSGAALARGAAATWRDGSCSAVACHGEGVGGRSAPALRWNDRLPLGACDSCHGAPPATPHARERGCDATLCHGGEVAVGSDGTRITEAGRARHIDGVVQFGRSP